jgi:hypothetical protein
MYICSIFLLKVARASRRWSQKLQRYHICTAVSMIPQCMSQRSQWLRWNIYKICIVAQRWQWLRCASHSQVRFLIIFLKLWIHEIWQASLWFGAEPQVKPWVWVLRFGLSCDSNVQFMVPCLSFNSPETMEGNTVFSVHYMTRKWFQRTGKWSTVLPTLPPSWDFKFNYLQIIC